MRAAITADRDVREKEKGEIDDGLLGNDESQRVSYLKWQVQ